LLVGGMPPSEAAPLDLATPEERSVVEVGALTSAWRAMERRFWRLKATFGQKKAPCAKSRAGRTAAAVARIELLRSIGTVRDVIEDALLAHDGGERMLIVLGDQSTQVLADIEATTSESAAMLRGTELAADPRLRGCLEQCKVVWKVMPPERLAQIEAMRRCAAARAQLPSPPQRVREELAPQAADDRQDAAAAAEGLPLDLALLPAQPPSLEGDYGRWVPADLACELVIGFAKGYISLSQTRRRVVRPALKSAFMTIRTHASVWRQGIRARTRAAGAALLDAMADEHASMAEARPKEQIVGMYVLFRGASVMA